MSQAVKDANTVLQKGVAARWTQPALQDTASLEWTVRLNSGSTLLLLVGADQALKVGVVEAVACADGADHVTLQCLTSCKVVFGPRPFSGTHSLYNGIRAVDLTARPEATFECRELPPTLQKCVRILIQLPVSGFSAQQILPKALQKALQHNQSGPAMSVAAALTLNRKRNRCAKLYDLDGLSSEPSVASMPSASQGSPPTVEALAASVSAADAVIAVQRNPSLGSAAANQASELPAHAQEQQSVGNVASEDEDECEILGNETVGETSYSNETSYQRNMMSHLGLESVGFAGTSPDGNCLFNAIAQGQSGLTAQHIKRHPGSGQQQQAQLREAAVAQIRSNVQYQQFLEENRSWVLSSHPELKPKLKHKKHASKSMAELLSSHVEADTVWVGPYCIKPLALALQVPIVVIESNRLYLYTCSLSNGGRTADSEPQILYPRPGTRKVKARFVPAEVLDKDTCFVIFNGRDHFWAALRSGPPITEAQLKAYLGDTIDYASSTLS